jgi:CBS domain-containing protein
MEIGSLVGGTASVCGPDLTLVEAAQTMMGEGIGSLGVVEAGRLVGILTERDVLRAVAEGVDTSRATVSEWMTPEPDCLTPDVDVNDAAEWLLATGYRHLPVMEGDTLLGIASIKDVLWAITDEGGGD